MAFRATMAMATTLLVFCSLTKVGRCARASVVFHESQSRPGQTTRILTQDLDLYATDSQMQASCTIETMQSESKLSDLGSVPIRNCGRLHLAALRSMLLKGPLPPSGPSHRGNSVPNNR